MRFRVHLQVRYTRAADFFVDYVENLSKGGLFIIGADHLVPLMRISVDIDLPGYGSYTVLAQVAHVLTSELAGSQGRRSGAGVTITKAPPGFEAALETYLHRLEQRRARAVLVANLDHLRQLAAAGYQARSLPPPDKVAAAIATCDLPVIGVAPPRAQLMQYRELLQAAGRAELLVPTDIHHAFEPILALLDERLG